MSPTARSAEEQLLAAVKHGTVGHALRTLWHLRQAIQVTVIDGLSTRSGPAATWLGGSNGPDGSPRRRPSRRS